MENSGKTWIGYLSAPTSSSEDVAVRETILALSKLHHKASLFISKC